ncbi:MAG: hypothetical protein JRI25_09175, partial [Deltaproteobacteria bacterium]|nr:hypothetical protein [Deltaproteobacteria bacterium]
DVYVGGSSNFTEITWHNNNLYGAPTQYSNYDQTGTNGNLSQPPVFTDETNDEFTLVWGSWCIDNGLDTTSYGVIDDYVGVLRPFGPGYDIGAYEYN